MFLRAPGQPHVGPGGECVLGALQRSPRGNTQLRPAAVHRGPPDGGGAGVSVDRAERIPSKAMEMDFW